MKNKLTTLMLLIVFGPYVIFSQDFKCGLNTKLAQLYAADPQLEKDHEALFKNGFQKVKRGDTKMVIFTIPIVFHIIHYNGSENITDTQVYDQVAILNRDYRLLNADTSIVIPEFKQLYADVGIEFKLATKDPYGNCTNGIEHIYSHETFQGDDYSKLNQWHRSNYLNVWVVDKMENGVAGYAFYPTAVDGGNFFRDGVIILNNYIGSIGTSSLNNSRALTHEIGHYLGLSHTWGSTNNPGVGCGDDYMEDTPITKGSNLVCDLTMQVCNPGIIENVQNYMDYSYCSRMFTIDQASAMRNIIQGESGNRNMLITDSTKVITGIDLTTPPTCIPIADFKSNLRMICQGETVQLTDQSYNAAVVNRQWFVSDGTANSLTSATPSVTFNTPGYKTIQLVVSNSAGTDSLEMYNYIFVSPQWADFTGPTAIDFENEIANSFIVDNPEFNNGNFELISSNGYNNSRCYRLDNFKDVSGATQYSPAYFYNNRLGGTIDALTSPSFDFSTTTNVEVSFKYAYATNAIELADMTEVLKVYSSKNCGQSWTLRKTITGAELVTAGSFGYQNFAPNSNSFWRTASFAVPTTNQDAHTRFKFEFTASDFSNNLYIDDINVGGILEVSPIEIGNDFTVYPNPSSNEDEIIVSFYNDAHPSKISLCDAIGNLIAQFDITNLNQEINLNISKNLNLDAGCYFVAKESKTGLSSKKVVVIKK